jgi:hypothetical protein
MGGAPCKPQTIGAAFARGVGLPRAVAFGILRREASGYPYFGAGIVFHIRIESVSEGNHG